jgi:hypothetical protein
MFLRFIGKLAWGLAVWPFKRKGKSERQINGSRWGFHSDGLVRFRDLGHRRPANARRGFESAS